MLIRNAEPAEFDAIGSLLVEVYANLDGFPGPDEQPGYYAMLAKVGELTHKPAVQLIVAASADHTVLGTVVYFGKMRDYGSGGTATQEVNSAGFRLLAVRASARQAGVGQALVRECMARAQADGRHQLIIHTTKAMLPAWKMYEAMGFERAPELDFSQGTLPVFGLRLVLPT